MFRKNSRLVSRRSALPGNPKSGTKTALAELLENRRLLSASLTTVATFSNLADADPNGDGGALIADSAGNLYGTAGGGNGNGIVFEVAAGSGQITTLASFNGSGEAEQPSGLVMDPAGNLYGETFGQGQSIGTPQYGALFKVVAGSHAITTLAVFNGTDGANPEGGLTLDSAGNLYGTCSSGGSRNAGTIFELPSGSSSITTLYNFRPVDNVGVYPGNGVVIDSAGNLFGTTTESNLNSAGDGTVFELAAGSGTLTLQGGTYNGLVPDALTRDAAGNLYGANGSDIVEIPPGGAASIIAAISGNSRVSGPLVLDASGNLFGETKDGGVNGEGSIFEVVAGSGTVTTLASFSGINSFANTGAERPQGGLVLDSAGNIYGLTAGGGIALGTVFKLTPNGSSASVLTAAAPAAQSATAGKVQQFDLGSFSASGATGPYIVTVNWGDGSTPATLQTTVDGTIPAQSHAYIASGSDTVTLTVADAVGNASNTISFNVAVGAAQVGTEGLTVSVTRSTVTPSIVAGTKAKGSVVISIDNGTGTALGGTGSIAIYAVDATGDKTLLRTASHRWSIKNSKSITISIPLSAIALHAGSYTLLPQLSLSGDSAYSTTGPTLSVAAANISLSATVAAVKPATLAVNKRGSVTVTVSNGGNVNASGSLVMTLSPSSDGVSTVAGVTLATVTRRVTIKPGKSFRYTLRFKIPAALSGGVYHPLATVLLDSQTATGFGALTFTVE